MGGAFAALLKTGTNWYDAFISLDDALGIATRSRKRKDIIKWLAKKDVGKIQQEHWQAITGIQRQHQLAIEEHEQANALLSDDLQDRDNQIQTIQYENVGLQDEIRTKDQQIAALQRRYKNNGISIIERNNEAVEYPYISICGQHGYRRHKARVLLARNQGSALFVDGDTPNAIATYNFWREHKLIVADPNRPRHFRLYDDKSGAVVGFEQYVKNADP